MKQCVSHFCYATYILIKQQYITMHGINNKLDKTALNLALVLLK